MSALSQVAPARSTQDYCPKCHAGGVVTRVNGVTTVAEHRSKKGRRCAQQALYAEAAAATRRS